MPIKEVGFPEPPLNYLVGREDEKKKEKREKNLTNQQRKSKITLHNGGRHHPICVGAWRSNLLPTGIPVLVVTQGRPTETKGSKTSYKTLVKTLMVSGPFKPS